MLGEQEKARAKSIKKKKKISRRLVRPNALFLLFHLFIQLRLGNFSTISVFLFFFFFFYDEKNKGFFNAKLISEKIVGSFYYLVGIEQSQF